MARPGLDKNMKFRNLCRMLGEPRPHVRGYLEYLWETAYETGNPVVGDALAIEAAAEYPGEHGKLFHALLTCGGEGRAGFIEPSCEPEGQYQVHDLFDHAPDYVQSRALKEAERRKEKNCEHCGRPYRSTEAHSRWCSGACRQAHYRQQNKRGKGKKSSKTLRRVTGGAVTVTGSDEPPAPAPAQAHTIILPSEEHVMPGEPGAEKTAASPAGENGLSERTTEPASPGDLRSPAEKSPKSGVPRKRDLLFDAIAEVTESDLTLRNVCSHIGKVCSDLRGADPPYTAEEVRQWAANLRSASWWDGSAPGIGYLHKEIYRVRQHSRPKPGARNAEQSSSKRFTEPLA